MAPEDKIFLRDFFRALEDRPLDPDDPAYVGLYDDRDLQLEDPVELLARSIEWAPTNTSAQLLSGFRGAGKSTELRRLHRQLTDAGYLVLLVDIFDYLSPSSPVDVTDFVMVLAGALSDALDKEKVFAKSTTHESYWLRLKSFLQSEVELKDVSAKLVVLDIKAGLHTDPTFRKRLQKGVEGHFAELVRDMQAYVRETITAIPADRLGSGLVLIMDSLERIGGTITNAQDVQESLERLFTVHAESLQLPQAHVVYTVPPWLKIRAPSVSTQFSGGLQMLHPLSVRRQEDAEPDHASLHAMCRIVSKRGDWERLLGKHEVLDRLALESGGHVRDLLRLLSEIVRRADGLPVSERAVERAITQVQSEMLPIALDDARWLQRIAVSHDASLLEISKLPRLVTFLDSHLVLCYRENGREWYDVHPLIRDEVAKLAATSGTVEVPAAEPSET
ncbi:MAG TPA: hypothetical protein VGF63_03650 [Solirubrobacteraceae bacterium]|jgi:hypothetical protein